MQHIVLVLGLFISYGAFGDPAVELDTDTCHVPYAWPLANEHNISCEGDLTEILENGQTPAIKGWARAVRTDVPKTYAPESSLVTSDEGSHHKCRLRDEDGNQNYLVYWTSEVITTCPVNEDHCEVVYEVECNREEFF